MAKAMLVDVSKCIGCRSCQVACKEWHDLPAVSTKQEGTYENPPELSASTWTKIEFKEFGEDGTFRWLFRKHQCMHCTEASCVEVCPTGAVAHHDEFVEINQEWCIGCGYCVTACPFGAVHREPPKGTARKCVFCIDRVTNGLEPACAKACPTGAIQFGERADLVEAAHRRVQTLIAEGYSNAVLYGENELGGLGYLYVLTDRPSVFNLPENPEVATSMVSAQWFSGIGTAVLLAAVSFWLFFKRKKRIEAIQQSKTEGGAEE